MELQQQPSQGLVFSYDFYPGLSFQVVSGLQQPTVNSILSPNGDQPVVDPTDYNGYIVRYQTSENTPGIYSFVFVRSTLGTLSQGTSYQFTADAQFFNNQVNLLEATIESGDGAPATPEETTPEETTPEETTPEETTPEETTPADEETPTPADEETTPVETTPEETTTTPANETTEEVVVETTTENGSGE